MPRTSPRADKDTYFGLVRKFPLKSIRTEADLDAATEVLRRLLEQELDAGGEQYRDALTDLTETYEDRAHPIPDASEADVLRHLLDANGLTQIAFAKKVGIPQSAISAVLTGARELTKDQLVTVARAFGVPPAAFLPSR